MIKLRLRRMGAKKRPSYRIVAAESRFPRDGRFIESIGFYNPLTDPATIRVDEDRARHWLSVGAQPSDTVRGILRRAGVATVDAAAETQPTVAEEAAPAVETPETAESRPRRRTAAKATEPAETPEIAESRPRQRTTAKASEPAAETPETAESRPRRRTAAKATEPAEPVPQSE